MARPPTAWSNSPRAANQTVTSRNTACQPAIGSGPPTGEHITAIPVAMSASDAATVRTRWSGPASRATACAATPTNAAVSSQPSQAGTGLLGGAVAGHVPTVPGAGAANQGAIRGLTGCGGDARCLRLRRR
ncbi:hypothetical protein [Alloactinosynnema sp. L-07]|nr:hypothetical protein [Alloactinosynnema sp. L-07]